MTNDNISSIRNKALKLTYFYRLINLCERMPNTKSFQRDDLLPLQIFTFSVDILQPITAPNHIEILISLLIQSLFTISSVNISKFNNEY